MIFPCGNACAQRELTIAKLFQSVGFKVVLIGYSNDGIQRSQINDFDVYTRPYPRGIRSWVKNITDSSYVKNIIEQYQGEKYILLVDYFVFATKKIIKYAKKKYIKLIFSAEEWYEKVKGFPRGIIKNFDTNYRMKKLYTKSDNMICISKFLYDYYSSKVKNIIQIPAIVDEDLDKWNIDRRPNPDCLQIIYAGNPGRGNVKERLDILLDAFAAFTKNKTRYQYKLIVVGLPKELLLQLSKYSADNIELFGQLSHCECLERIAESHYSCIPRERNLKNNAGFPTKMAESFACGTPVISTRISNVDEFIMDYQNGFIVDQCTKETFISVFEKIENLSIDEIETMKITAKEKNVLVIDSYRNIFEEFIKNII